MVEHANDGGIIIRPSRAAQLAGTIFLVIANLPALFPVALLLLYPSGRTWQPVLILGGSAIAWLVVVTFWQAGNQPWMIHANATTLWTTRLISGRQMVPRSDLTVILAASARYLYAKGTTQAEPTYHFIDRQGQVRASVKAADYQRADFEALSRYIDVPLKGDFKVDISDELKGFKPGQFHD